MRQAELNLLPASAGFLFGLLFDPEDGADMLLQNVRLSELHTVTYKKTVCTLFFSFLVEMLVIFYACYSSPCQHDLSTVLFYNICCLQNYSSVTNSLLDSQSESMLCPHEMYL
jgi:hypothetical protein